MADSKDPDEQDDPFATGKSPAPYWAQPGEPIGPPQEQIPAEHPPHWQQPYGAPAGQQWGPAPPQYGGFPGEKPNNYLTWAVLSTLLFCLPLGVTSIYYATRVNQRWQAGDHAGAVGASERAKKFAIASAVTGVVAVILLLATRSG
jgi:hypothetical protein